MSQRNMNRIGLIVAIILGSIGLIAVAVFVVMAVLMQSFGSNK